MHNSQWIIFLTQSWLVLYCFCDNLLHLLIMQLIVLSLSPHNQHLVSCCIFYYYYYHYYYYSACKLFPSVVTGGFYWSLSNSNSSQVSMDGLASSSDFQFLQSLYQAFGNHSMSTYYKWLSWSTAFSVLYFLLSFTFPLMSLGMEKSTRW